MGESFRLAPGMASRKLQALAFIKGYFARWGQSPSLGEIAGALRISRQRAHELVERLSDEAQIRRVRGKARGIRLIDPAEEISQADALLALRREGWRIDNDALAIERPLTEAELSGLPFLDHKGDRDGPVD